MTTAALTDTQKLRVPRGPHLGRFKYLSVARTHAGRVRELNEDAYLDRPDIGLWAVADGMGGHDNGEVAADLVVEALSRIDVFASAPHFRDAALGALQAANSALVERALERLSDVMGATVAALLAYQDHYACVWAGDSRVYLLRAGQLRRLTRDHSVVQEMLDAGQLRRDQMRHHARAHVVTRAVGAADELKLDVVSGRTYPGDRFLLCSDGLSNLVEDDELGDILARPPLQKAVERMIDLALRRGAPDNVTAVLVGAEKA